jgi:DNA ligase (NAD+)
LEWYQEKSVNNLLEAIEKSRKVNIINFLVSLSIYWVGKKIAKILAPLFKEKKDFLNFSYSLEELENLEDIWPEIAKHIFNYFNLQENKDFLAKLFKEIKIKFLEEKNIDKDNKFFWKKFCITWSFTKDWKKISREELIEILEWLWAKYVSSVSKNLDFLLAWEKAWSKLKKAQDLGVEVLGIENVL